VLVGFAVEAWSALAPGLENETDWLSWLENRPTPENLSINANLKQIPPILRRRFNALGKCAMGAVTQLLENDQKLPSIFASRHGDTPLTLSLLESMAKDEPMSPTGFSLAVHNAVSGLYSIAKKDNSAVTAISSMQGLIINTLCEAVGQLQDSERVLCVIYDVPLPAIYQKSCKGDSFPFAVAMLINRSKGQLFQLKQNLTPGPAKNLLATDDIGDFVACLLGATEQYQDNLNGVNWNLVKIKNHAG